MPVSFNAVGPAVDLTSHCLSIFFRAVLFTHFSSIWTKSIIEPATIRKTATVLLALGLSLISDISTMDGDFRAMLPAYVALVTHALSSSGLEHTQGVLSPALGSTFTTAASTLGACLIFLPLYMFREVLVSRSPVMYVWCTYPIHTPAPLSYHSNTSAFLSSCPSSPLLYPPLPVTQYFPLTQQRIVLAAVLHGLLPFRLHICVYYRCHGIGSVSKFH